MTDTKQPRKTPARKKAPARKPAARKPAVAKAAAPPNEIVAAAREASDRKKAASKKNWPIAVGIGSAALAAALIYSNRGKKKG